MVWRARGRNLIAANTQSARRVNDEYGALMHAYRSGFVPLHRFLTACSTYQSEEMTEKFLTNSFLSFSIFLNYSGNVGGFPTSGSILPVSDCRNATNSFCSWAVSPSGLISLDNQGFLTPPRL